MLGESVLHSSPRSTRFVITVDVETEYYSILASASEAVLKLLSTNF